MKKIFILLFLFVTFIFSLFLFVTPKNAYAHGATSLTNGSQTCVGGAVRTSFSWAPMPDVPSLYTIKDAQYLDLSLDPGMGSFLGANVFGRTSYTTTTSPGENIGHLDPGKKHYWRINTRFVGSSEWHPSAIQSFDTQTCSVASPSPSPSTPPSSWTLNNPTISGTNVTFTWNSPANDGVVLIIRDMDDPAKTAVWNSGNLSGRTTITADYSDETKWLRGPGIPVDGNFDAVLVYILVDVSNRVNFTIGVDVGPPPDPFNVGEVFQPASRFQTFGKLASDVVLILTGIAGGLLLFFIVLAGYKYTTSSGDPKKIASANATLTYAIIGFAVVVLAFVIVRILQFFLKADIPVL